MHFRSTLSKIHFLKLLPRKMNFKITVTKIFFISTHINAVKDKTDRDKSLIMHD